MELSNVLEGKEVKHNGETLYVIERTLPELPIEPLTSEVRNSSQYLTPENIARTFPDCLAYNIQKANPRTMEDILFIDIETRGLAHKHPIFLISLGQYVEGGMKLTSLFARDYSEEKPILSYFLEMLHNSSSQVTFNGRSFDLPHISKRAQNKGLMINGYKYRELGDVLRDTHVDLIDYYDGGLQNTEKLSLAFIRKGDISGAAIPEIYRKYVYNQGNQKDLFLKVNGIVTHNMIDVASLGALFAKMCKDSAIKGNGAKESYPLAA